ncbi:MAG: methyltransferase domain-containing protein [Anaerolineae bacterium]|nr:methyltransferase domain-containing protein [Anaerolineae bacterium]
MPREDATRWNSRYITETGLRAKSPLQFLLDNVHILPKNGLALDIAMGAGRNAEVLINHGLEVIGIDISFEGVLLAKTKHPKLHAIVADLANFQIPRLKFDVITNFYYLQRSILEGLHLLTKPGGIIMIETLTRKMKTIHPDTPEDFLLHENELPGYFNESWQIIKYQEGWRQNELGKKKAVASIIAKYLP